MKFYIEITLTPKNDFIFSKLWSQLFTQIHLGLVENQNNLKQFTIGISFPEYKFKNNYGFLGNKCRLFCENRSILEQFSIEQKLIRLNEYVHYSEITSVPQKLLGYAIYRREQTKTNPERLARRYAKRHNLDFEVAFNSVIKPQKLDENNNQYSRNFRYSEMEPRLINFPFIQLFSLSGKKNFTLRISKTVASNFVPGEFNSYGLSSTSTVPEF